MLKDIQPGQYIFIYHDSVIGHRPEVTMSYHRVVSVTPKTVVLMWQHDPKPFRKKREWVEANFYPLKQEDWHPEIKIE